MTDAMNKPDFYTMSLKEVALTLSGKALGFDLASLTQGDVDGLMKRLARARSSLAMKITIPYEWGLPGTAVLLILALLFSLFFELVVNAASQSMRDGLTLLVYTPLISFLLWSVVASLTYLVTSRHVHRIEDALIVRGEKCLITDALQLIESSLACAAYRDRVLASGRTILPMDVDAMDRIHSDEKVKAAELEAQERRLADELQLQARRERLYGITTKEGEMNVSQ